MQETPCSCTGFFVLYPSGTCKEFERYLIMTLRTTLLSAAAALVLAAPSMLIAQRMPGGKYGFAQFPADSGHAMVEFYYQIPTGGLQFHAAPNGKLAATVMCSFSAEQTGVVRASENWQFTAHRSGASEPDRNLIGV